MKSKSLNLRISEKHDKVLRKRAEKDQRPRATMARLILENALDNKKK